MAKRQVRAQEFADRLVLEAPLEFEESILAGAVLVIEIHGGLAGVLAHAHSKFSGRRIVRLAYNIESVAETDPDKLGARCRELLMDGEVMRARVRAVRADSQRRVTCLQSC